MKILLWLTILLLLVKGISAGATCTPVPGAADLWSKASLRWVWVGEWHGTAETPEVFGDLVCDALAHGKHVTVALERPTSEQPALDAMMSAKSARDAERMVIHQMGWQEVFDGRSSQAMLKMLRHLRELRTHYPALRVKAIDGPDYGGGPGERDEAMGKSVLALAGSQPNDLVLVLTGNLHAMKRALPAYQTSVMFLPADQVFSLFVTDRGGEAWIATDRGCGSQPRTNPDRDKTRPFGIYEDPGYVKSGFDGVFALGRQVTASSPANSTAAEASPCRKDYLTKRNAGTQ